jgi:metaxin
LKNVIYFCFFILAQEQWPQPIVLYQQYDVDQILLPDNANCLAVQAYLKMCNLEFTVESRWNAEHMSPSGKIPFITCGPCIISDFDNIVSYINNKGINLTENLPAYEKANLRAYMALVNNVLYYAELYICWSHDDTYNNITKKRYGVVYPWPLNDYLCWQKRNQIIKNLSIFPWTSKSLQQVIEEVKKCCDCLSKKLSDNLYFFGNR